jgi:hypothetical protein
MKFIFLYVAMFLLLLACNSQQKSKGDDLESSRKKIYIYSTSNDCVNINWYCYSNIGGFSSSNIEFADKNTGYTLVMSNYYISDIEIKKDNLKIQFWSGDTSGIIASKIPCFKHILIDTTGDQNKNGIDARISRILEANIDYTKPHKFYSKAL